MSNSSELTTTDNATVSVVQVSLKAIVIGKKQMTLSVFRQLQNEAVWDDVLLRSKGVVWGLVNYFWGSCGCPDYLRVDGKSLLRLNPSNFGGCYHIVWQKGAELRRSCLIAALGEAQSGYHLKTAVNSERYTEHLSADTSSKDARAWLKFYRSEIAVAEQLFIAV